MRAKNILGIIFSNMYDDCLHELTALRTMASVPFGGRYRLIDFHLSNMVNCGIDRVGVVTKGNYRSLMDHLGNGKPWDLSRKRDGLFLLPPFNSDNSSMRRSRMDSLISILPFIESTDDEFVIMTDCNVVCSMDYSELIDFHLKSCADVTICCKRGCRPELQDIMTFETDENGRVEKLAISPKLLSECLYSLNIILMRKSVLERLIAEAVSLNYTKFTRDILQRNVDTLNIYAYEYKGFSRTIDSLKSYYDISLELLDRENRKQLFRGDRPVYTKVRDDMPAIYGINCKATNSLIADGCHIEGEVENCILFRGARVGKNAVVKNSIIMQGTIISEGAVLNHVITDKNVTVTQGKNISGAESYPIYIGKGIRI
ncbi:MAG: glucose-1-phosphate adenylyltransferase subunit GlgD [Clostridiales bacterium]|jgi:glucose-1-phosphate adenylyltransferase|nr:glucose-1-phosphate adenylyltransferase subunit GlgD [Clostridiales bacterium]